MNLGLKFWGGEEFNRTLSSLPFIKGGNKPSVIIHQGAVKNLFEAYKVSLFRRTRELSDSCLKTQKVSLPLHIERQIDGSFLQGNIYYTADGTLIYSCFRKK